MGSVLRFRLFGMPVTVRGSFLLIAAIIGFIGVGNPQRTIALIAVIFVSILIHELGHAVTARMYGSEVAIELNGFGGLTRWTVPQGELTPGRRALIAAAGFLLLGYAVFRLTAFLARQPQHPAVPPLAVAGLAGVIVLSREPIAHIAFAELPDVPFAACVILALCLLGGERGAVWLRPITVIGSDALMAFSFHIVVIFLILRFLFEAWQVYAYPQVLGIGLALILLLSVNLFASSALRNAKADLTQQRLFGSLLGLLDWRMLLAAAVISSACGVFFHPAETALLRRVVPPEHLPQALAHNEARQYGASIAGPPLGGLLFNLGRPIPLAGELLAYLLSFAAVLAMKDPTPAAPATDRSRTLLRDIAEGLRWTWRQRFLRVLLVTAAGFSLVFSALTLTSIVAARQSGAAPADIGLMMAISGAGGLLGALAAPQLQRRNPAAVVLAMFWVAAAAIPAMAVHPTAWAIGPLLAAAFFLAPAANAILYTYQMTITPDHLQGRVISSLALIGSAVTPVGAGSKLAMFALRRAKCSSTARLLERSA